MLYRTIGLLRHAGFAAEFQKYPFDFIVRELDADQPLKLTKECQPLG